MTIAAYVPNLFDRSRFGTTTVFVETPAEVLGHRPRLLLVDLDRCDRPEDFLIAGIPVIGFGSHVDTDLQQRAVDAGYDQVLARSVFFRRLPQLLDQQPVSGEGE